MFACMCVSLCDIYVHICFDVMLCELVGNNRLVADYCVNKSGGFVVATVTNPGSFMATITHPTGNGYCRDRILLV